VKRLRSSALTAGLAVLLGCLTARAQADLVQKDYSSYALRLESKQHVTTWEAGGVRVFVAEKGALLRQGPLRLAAPRMVVWFDRAQSGRPGVQAALVMVYAEGIPARDGVRARPVRLVEGRRVRECGAAFVHFRSAVAFVWDAPTVASDGAVPSALLSRAEQMTQSLEQDKCWEAPPAAGRAKGPSRLREMFHADEVQVFPFEQPVTLVFMGDVHATIENMRIRADSVVVWYDQDKDSYEAFAEGNVRVYRRPGAVLPPEERPAGPPAIAEVLQSLRADKAYINPGAARGMMTNTELRLQDPLDPEGTVYVVRGKKAFLVDSKTLLVHDVTVTTSPFARPSYQIHADKVQVLREKGNVPLNAWDARLQVGRSQRTVLRVPFIGVDLARQAYLLTDYAIGASTKFGPFVQTTWRPLDLTVSPEWVDKWTVNLDYYGARGPALGSELDYEVGRAGYPHHKGMARMYYVLDNGDEDDTGRPVPQTSRGRFQIQHRTELNRYWRLDAELYYLSDEGFLPEYFEPDYEKEKPPESYLLARYLRSSTYLALLYKRRVNDFLTQIEQSPSADLEFVGVPLGRFVYEGGVKAGHYDLELSDQLTPAPADPPGLTRVHTEHKLSLPFMAGIFRFDPFVRVLGTWASEGVRGSGTFGGSPRRTGLGMGVMASTTLSRSFDVTSETFDLNRLRHIVTPYAGVETLSTSGDGSARFLQMDAVDAIDSGTQAIIGLRQRLQTKRRSQGRWVSRDWAMVDVAYVSRSSDSAMSNLDADYLRADLQVHLTEHIAIHSQDNLIGGGSLPDVLNVGARFDYLPRWALEVNYDRISDRNSTLTVDLSRMLSDRYMLMLRQQSEFDSMGTGKSTNLKTRIVIRRLFQDWVLDVGLDIDKANNNTAIIFGFGPRGWGFYTGPRRAGR